MRSILNLTEQQHRERLKRRHLRGIIHENLYRVSLVVAFTALIILLIQISNQAFGPVLTVPLVSPDELSDRPLTELPEDELAEILVNNMGAEFLNLFRDNFGTVGGVSFVQSPISETLRGRTLPDDVAEQADELTFADLNNAQLAEILALNTNEDQIRTWIQSEVIGEDVILEWSWITGVFQRESIYVDSAANLAGDIAREALRAIDGEITIEALVPGIVDAVGEANAEEVAAQFQSVISILVDTDWNIESRRVNVSMALSENGESLTQKNVDAAVANDLRPDMIDAFMAAGIASQPAEVISSEFVEDIAETGAIAELEAIDQRDILAALMVPDFADVLKNNQYFGASVHFRSWLNGDFLFARGQNSVPELASLRTAVLGSIWVMIITMMTAFPLGVGAAIYLEEYATDNWLNNMIETNIRNLAGVPSIIYGLLGLAVFVRALVVLTGGAASSALDSSTVTMLLMVSVLITYGGAALLVTLLGAWKDVLRPVTLILTIVFLGAVTFLVYGALVPVLISLGVLQLSASAMATLNGRTVMSAGLTLALLILPVIIINAQEAIRAVPSTIREASYGLGATKWQTIWHQILPAAVPGILTGTILAFSRAVGETAPLIVVGAASAINADPTLFSKFTVIPIQIFQWTEEARPEYQHLAAAAIIVLLVLLIALNSIAILLRNRYSQVKA